VAKVAATVLDFNIARPRLRGDAKMGSPKAVHFNHQTCFALIDRVDVRTRSGRQSRAQCHVF
jgi:hypothetical protein